MTAIRATQWMRKLRYMNNPDGSFGPRYWILGIPVRRKTYWGFMRLCGWRS